MKYRILVVDDSKLARMAVAKALSALYPDWVRLEAANADEALALAKTNPSTWRSSTSTCPGATGFSSPRNCLP